MVGSLLSLAKENMLSVQILSLIQVHPVKTPPLLMITTVISYREFSSVLWWFPTLELGWW